MFHSRALHCHVPSQHYWALKQSRSSSVSIRCPKISAAAGGGGRENTCNVCQSLTFFSLDPEFTDNDISEVIDGTWSLQYMVRGPICGSAGPVLIAIVPGGKGEEDAVKGYNNCILFRYASDTAMDQFMSHGKTKYMLDEISREKTTRGVVSLTFSAKIPNELEAIFRRGDEWEQGYELFLGLQDAERHPDADEFLDLLCQLALSSAHGAVQASHGPVTGIINHTLHDEQEQAHVFECDTICSIRFVGDDSVIESFLHSPPMQAIITGDKRSPVTLSWGVVQHIVPPPEKDQGGSTTM